MSDKVEVGEKLYGVNDIEYLIGEIELIIAEIELKTQDQGIWETFGKKFCERYSVRIEFLKRKFLKNN